MRGNRINFASFDLTKGIGILVVVLTHTLAHLNWKSSAVLRFFTVLIRFIGPGAIPAFFMISGWGFKYKSPPKMLKKTFFDLLVPYLYVMLAYAILVPITYYPVYHSWEASTALATRYVVAFLFGFGPDCTTIFGYETMWCTAAWYLIALFVALNILNLIVQIKNRFVQIGCAILCPIIGAILFHFNFVFYCIPQGLMAVGYCYLGYVFKKHGFLDQVQSPQCKWICLILLPVYFMEIMWGYFDLCQGLFHNVFLDYLGTGCFGILALLATIYFGNFEWRCVGWIKKIGVYSYWIFSIHAVEMEVIPWYYLLNLTLPEHQFLAFMIEYLFKTVIIATGCVLLRRISKRKYRRRILRNGK